MQSMQHRRRNRIALAAVAIAGACAAVTVAGVMSASAADRPAPRKAAPAAAAAPAAPASKALGDVVPTGIRLGGGELVLYGVPVHESQLPGVHFGVMAGTRAASGALRDLVETNEVTGSDRSPGFHAVEAPINGVPEFGYYAGPAVRITGTVAGHTVAAGHAVWSVDRNVVLFWFAPGANPTDLAAYDKAGHRLPTGNAGAGQG